MVEYYTDTNHFGKVVGESQTFTTSNPFNHSHIGWSSDEWVEKTGGYWYHGNGKIGGEFHPTKPNDEEHYGEYVKVVRCKDCKHQERIAGYSDYQPNTVFCNKWEHLTDIQGHCYKGERKDEVEE